MGGGAERDVVVKASPRSTLEVIEAFIGGEMQTRRYLTVVDASKCARVLAAHADRVLSLLRKARVVDT